MGRISRLRLAVSVLSCSLAIARLLVNLLLIWLTFGWNVRRARRAFEKQLVKEGMSRSDAQRVSAQYTVLRRNIEKAFKQSLGNWRTRPRAKSDLNECAELRQRGK